MSSNFSPNVPAPSGTNYNLPFLTSPDDLGLDITLTMAEEHQPLPTWGIFNNPQYNLTDSNNTMLYSEPNPYTMAPYQMLLAPAPHEVQNSFSPNSFSPNAFSPNSYSQQLDMPPMSTAPLNVSMPLTTFDLPPISAPLHQYLYQPTIGSPGIPPSYAMPVQQVPNLSTAMVRQISGESIKSNRSSPRRNSAEKVATLCPYEGCGRFLKDMKAHLLTHLNERPEKCPVSSCDFHLKGFSRRYDRNRHVLIHFKGEICCLWCDDHKYFTRIDAFRKHLTLDHGCKQEAPNSKRRGSKREPIPGGPQVPCSVCGEFSSSIIETYEHIEDCIMEIICHPDSTESINEDNLTITLHDQAVHETLMKHNLPVTTTEFNTYSNDEEEDDDECDEDSKENQAPSTPRGKKRGADEALDESSRGKKRGRPGLTHSKRGVKLNPPAKKRRSKKDLPASWGEKPEQLTMKKRVMVAFDGPRRLVKDDMMLNKDSEVITRYLPTPPGEEAPLQTPYLTDLNQYTVQRADAVHGATEAERGPWNLDDLFPAASSGEDATDMFPSPPHQQQ